MRIDQSGSDSAALEELGDRLSRHRLNRNQTQEALANEAGVSLRTIVRIEQGKSVQLTNLIRVLRGLHLLDNLEALVSAPPVSPIQQIKMHGKRRERASSSPARPASTKPWRWDDEQ